MRAGAAHPNRQSPGVAVRQTATMVALRALAAKQEMTIGRARTIDVAHRRAVIAAAQIPMAETGTATMTSAIGPMSDRDRRTATAAMVVEAPPTVLAGRQAHTAGAETTAVVAALMPPRRGTAAMYPTFSFL